MSYVIDADANIPVFGVDVVVIQTAEDTAWPVLVNDISYQYTGEKVVAKDGLGEDVARIYYNREVKTCTINCWPFAATEEEGWLVNTVLKHGTLIKIDSAARHPGLVGFWRVTDCPNSANNTDKKTVSLSLEWSIKQTWA